MDKKNTNIHIRHRERLRRRFMRRGLADFDDHIVLELLLFYAIPRADTNPVGHRLISHFGSLSAVFDASYEELLKIDGIGPRSAELIKLIPNLAARYREDKFTLSKDTMFDDHVAIGDYLTAQYMTDTRERIVLLLFDNAMRLLKTIELDKGSVNSAMIDLRKFVDFIVTANAAACAIAHNHPNGTLIPSEDDLYTTRHIRRLCDQINVRLVEHFLVAEDKWIGLVEYIYETKGE
ncbi:MAG: hypothetical protein FWB93_04915 [Oscillospiraceae bacterium]|nr:hypothetical protein [Oscillospiraceae bacterium]